MKTGYLGPKGTFSHEAVAHYLRRTGLETELIACPTIPDMIQAVEDGLLDEAIVPIENSIEGAVTPTLDELAGDHSLFIRDEVIIDIVQNLLVRPGTDRSDIRYVLTHPQPAGQCRQYLRTCLPDAEVVLTHSTAAAAIEVAAGREASAAVGASASADAYGLEIMEDNIQDASGNQTRFVVVGKKKADAFPGKAKTSIVFSTTNEPGALFRVLEIFSLWNVNMTRIESRPSKSGLGTYIFFIDLDGHADEPDIRDALTMVRRKTSFYKYLGSYPVNPGR